LLGGFTEISGNVRIIALFDDETWTRRKIDKKYLESVGTRCRRRMNMMIWTNHVTNDIESKKTEISYIQYKDGRLIRLVVPSVGRLLKHILE
jgi:hypothetical protein